MIKHIAIKNFKGINSLEITPKKFNVLVGRNNTGKTSILEAISVCTNPNLIKDLLMYKYGPFFINYSSDKASIKIDTDDNKVKKLNLRNPTPEQILNLLKNDLNELSIKKDNVYVDIGRYIDVEKIIKVLDKDSIYEASLDSIAVLVNYSDHPVILTAERYKDLLIDTLSKLYDTYIFKNEKNSATGKSNSNRMEFRDRLNMLRYRYPLTRNDSFIIDKKDNVTFINDTLLSAEFFHKSQKLALQVENIIKKDNIIPNLKRFDFYSIVLDTEEGDQEIPVESMGDGFKSLVHIIIKLYDNEGDIIVIEEPENYMHPGYIRELIHYIISIANNSHVQLFITTHSQDFLYTLISDDALPEKDIEFLKKELLILQFSKWKDDIILSNLDYNDAVSDMEDLLLDLRGI